MSNGDNTINTNNNTNFNVSSSLSKVRAVLNPYKVKLLGNKLLGKKVWVTDQDDLRKSKNTPRSRGQRGQQVGKKLIQI